MRRPLRRSDGELPGPAGGGAVTADPRRAQHRRRHLALIAAGVAGAALLAIGVIVGSSLAGRGSAAKITPTTAGFPNPPPGPPPSAFPVAPGGSPQIVLLQPIGDPDTVFLIHGTGWAPRSHVTVTLTGHGQSPVRPVVDLQGTFNYAVNQGHEFFPRRMPPGVYHLVVTGPGGRRARASFQVNPPPGGHGPSGP